MDFCDINGRRYDFVANGGKCCFHTKSCRLYFQTLQGEPLYILVSLKIQDDSWDLSNLGGNQPLKDYPPPRRVRAVDLMLMIDASLAGLEISDGIEIDGLHTFVLAPRNGRS